MSDESIGLGGHAVIPIPTYEEASSLPSSSQYLGPQYRSQDAERQTLLSQHDDPGIYRATTIESVRSSLDSFGGSQQSDESMGRGFVATEELRTEMAQMEFHDSDEQNRYSPLRFSKRITILTNSLSSMNLSESLQQMIPSWDYIKARVPEIRVDYILMSRLFAILLVVSVAYVLFVSNLFHVGRTRTRAGWSNDAALRSWIRDNVDEGQIRDHLRYLTSFDHVAGTAGDATQAYYVETIFREHLGNVQQERFDVYLNFPGIEAGSRRVAIVEPLELAWDAQIEENVIWSEDPTRVQVPVFYGYSRSGTAQGNLVYANDGSKDDFDRLLERGISMNGSIALVRYGGTQPDLASMVRAAELAGAVGCIIYTDPVEAGLVHGEVWPKGRFMPSDAVERGTVARSAWVLGDVLTPGYPSLPSESQRDSKDNNPGLNNIPSIPLGWRDAQRLLQSLKGRGIKLTKEWGVGGVPDVEWWTGDEKSPIVLLKNEQDEVDRRPIYNVLGRIVGTEQPEKSIIIGNHRDALCFGAADPAGGTAVLLEVIRLLGRLTKLGWKPLRTIEFASWDGEEYNMIGSTEHVEANMDDLVRNAMVYINLDVAAIGRDFEAKTSPVLNTALLHAMEDVVDPNENRTLRAIFADRDGTFGGLDAGSDYAAFQMLAGCSSLDMGFNGPAYPQHSCYDNHEWMEKFGDPGYRYHKTIALVMIFLILDLANREILPFDFTAYADAVRGYVSELESHAQSRHDLDFSALHHAADEFSSNARQFDQWSAAWAENVYETNSGFESNALAIKRMSHNTRMSNFESNLLDMDNGLPGREQFRHIIFAPQAGNSHASTKFPSVRDAVDDGDWTRAQKAIERVSSILSYAARKPNH